MSEEKPSNQNITAELLIRLDERTSSIKNEIVTLKEQIADLKRQIKDQKSEEREVLKNYVTREEFEPIKKGFYGIAFLMISTVIGTIIATFAGRAP